MIKGSADYGFDVKIYESSLDQWKRPNQAQQVMLGALMSKRNMV
jgi:hypothetical protein